MEMIQLEAQVREGTGKGPARRLRVAGSVPAVFYGPQRTPVMLSISAREFALQVSSLEGAHLIRFRSSAEQVNERVALVKDAQYHPVTGKILHADFYEVDLAKRILVKAPLHFTGKSVGVALGGILQPVRREIEVRCLPTDIPEFVSVDVTSLGIHDAVHVSQIALPSGVEAVFDDDFAVVTVIQPSVEEARAGATEGAAAAAPADAAKAKDSAAS